MQKFKNPTLNNKGFMTAEFLFAFTMVIGCGIVIFSLTFALTTIEVAQYIVWSSARSFAVGNKTAEDSERAGKTKFDNLRAAFPLLTGSGSDSPWFKMTEFRIGDLTASIKSKDSAIDKDNAASPGGEARHPWIGVESNIDLILFKNSQIPFLGKVTASPDDFNFPVRAILFRHPSFKECRKFFEEKFSQGMKRLPSEPEWKNLSSRADIDFVPMEDNGC